MNPYTTIREYLKSRDWVENKDWLANEYRYARSDKVNILVSMPDETKKTSEKGVSVYYLNRLKSKILFTTFIPYLYYGLNPLTKTPKMESPNYSTILDLFIQSIIEKGYVLSNKNDNTSLCTYEKENATIMINCVDAVECPQDNTILIFEDNLFKFSMTLANWKIISDYFT